MKRLWDLLRSPVLWLSVLAPVALLWQAGAGRLEPIETLDTLSHEVLREFDTAAEVLSSVRTYGYSAFLALYDRLFTDTLLTPHSRLPELHFAAYWAAVLLFAAALVSYLESRAAALVASLPLADACALGLLPLVQSDFLSVALAVAALSFLLLVAARPANPWFWAGLTLATLATYHTRPAYLFLIVLFPVAGTLLRHCHRPTSARRLGRHLLLLIAVAWLPYLAFCGLRRAVVGEFTLVSFGGYQLIGVSATFLDDELVAELPPEEQAFAREILDLRRARGWSALPPSGSVRRWQGQQSDNIFEIAEPVIRGALMADRDSAADRAVAERWAFSRHDVAVPPLCGEIVLVTNQRMLRLSREIIERRPGYWVRWIHGGLLHGLTELDTCVWIRFLGILVLLTLPLTVLRLATARGDRAVGGRDPAWRRFVGLGLTGIGFFLLKLVLVSAANWPLERFLTPMHIFLPSLLALALFELWRLIREPRAAARWRAR